MDTLANIEQQETDGQDVPKQSIVIEQTIVYWNPFKRAQEKIDAKQLKKQQL